MSFDLIVTEGFGNGTVVGSVARITSLGYKLALKPASRRRTISVFSRKAKKIKGRTALRFSKRSTLKV